MTSVRFRLITRSTIQQVLNGCSRITNRERRKSKRDCQNSKHHRYWRWTKSSLMFHVYILQSQRIFQKNVFIYKLLADKGWKCPCSSTTARCFLKTYSEHPKSGSNGCGTKLSPGQSYFWGSPVWWIEPWYSVSFSNCARGRWNSKCTIVPNSRDWQSRYGRGKCP